MNSGCDREQTGNNGIEPLGYISITVQWHSALLEVAVDRPVGVVVVVVAVVHRAVVVDAAVVEVCTAPSTTVSGPRPGVGSDFIRGHSRFRPESCQVALCCWICEKKTR